MLGEWYVLLVDWLYCVEGYEYTVVVCDGDSTQL